jgi:hypothetical protein
VCKVRRSRSPRSRRIRPDPDPRFDSARSGAVSRRGRLGFRIGRVSCVLARGGGIAPAEQLKSPEDQDGEDACSDQRGDEHVALLRLRGFRFGGRSRNGWTSFGFDRSSARGNLRGSEASNGAGIRARPRGSRRLLRVHLPRADLDDASARAAARPVRREGGRDLETSAAGSAHSDAMSHSQPRILDGRPGGQPAGHRRMR